MGRLSVAIGGETSPRRLLFVAAITALVRLNGGADASPAPNLLLHPPASKTTTPPLLRECPSPPSNSLVARKARWRESSDTAEILLRFDNALCRSGSLCFSGVDNETSASSTSSPPPPPAAPGSSNAKNSPVTASSVAEALGYNIQAGDSLGIRVWLGDGGNLMGSELSNASVLRIAVVNAVDFNSVSCGNFLPQPDDILLEEAVGEMTPNQSLVVQSALLPSGVNRFLILLSEPSCDVLWAVRVTVRLQECGQSDGFDTCSNHGHCLLDSDKETYACHCCPGYIGRYCEEKDGCQGSPCQNGGFCVDIAEGLYGTFFQCLCAHGFRGQTCDERVNLCDKRPCQNNGTCAGNDTEYWCECPSGFSGRDCEVNINECQPNPCVHGVCEDAVAKYKCYCLPGYGGDHCEFEYDECDSSPCINGGQCQDLVAGYRCLCGPGYRGWRCQIKVDLCEPNPCPEPAQCVDRGNNYSCICHPGINAPGCTQHYDPCYPNPCQNGGSCWPSLDSFFCSCKPGYTGDMCEELVYQPKPMAHTLEDTSVHSGSGGGGSSGAGVGGGPASGPPGGLGVPLEHLRNVYIASATLAGACAIVILVVGICHCRVHKTYATFTRSLQKSCSDLKKQKLEDTDKLVLNLHGNASERRLYADSVYEATCVDIADSQNAPLIE